MGSVKERGVWFSRALLVFSLLFFVGVSSVLVLDVDRIAWFDEAFSLETARMVGEGSVNFYEHDVHPPVYYTLLSVWGSFNPGLTETQWARFLSVTCVALFLLVVFFILRTLKYSSFVSSGVVFLMSGLTSLFHYGTEIRMYGLLMLVSSLAMFFAIRWVMTRSHSNRMDLWASALLVALLPFIHYFGAIIGLIIITMLGLVWFKIVPEKGCRKVFYVNILFFISVYVFSTVLAASMALAQRARISHMWFDYSGIGSYPSSLLFGFHYTEGMSDMLVMWVLSIVQILLLLVVVGYFIRMFFVKNLNKRSIIMLLFMFMSIGPLLLIIASHYVLDLYHHRFILPFIWLFVVAVFTGVMSKFEFCLKRRNWLGIGVFTVLVIAIVIVNVLVQYEYVDSTYRVQERAFLAIPCDGATVLHETPFTYVPLIVWDREHGCDRSEVLGTLLSEGEGHSSGFDAIDPSKIIYFDEELQYVVDGPTYYFTGYHYFLMVSEDSGVVVYNGSQLLPDVGNADWLSVLYVEG